MVAPPRAFGGDFDRGWLLAVQLYGVRSARNWGIGDFTDLEGLIELAGHLGADGVGLNPLHALFDDRPADCSPYSPNSRLFLNALYIDVEKLPEFQPGDCRIATALARLQTGRHRRLCRASPALKWRALRSAFESFRAIRPPAAGRISKNFAPSAGRCCRGSPASRCCGTSSTSRGGNGRKNGGSPMRPNAPACAQGPDAAEIEFVEFVQWTADRQLAGLPAIARTRSA